MTIKEIINDASKLINDRELIEYMSSFGSSFTNDGSEGYKTAVNMAQMTNSVINDIAVNFVAFIKSESVSNPQEKVYYSALTQTPSEILRVFNKTGEELSFTVYPEYVQAQDVIEQIEYAFIPSKKTYQEEIGVDTTKIPYSAIVYGMLSEYFLSICRLEEAIIWHEKFIATRDKAKRLAKVKQVKNYKIKKRGWV